MAEKSPSTPAQSLQKIEAGSQRVNRLATELSHRIAAFEAWLNQLPGKIETYLWLPDSDRPDDPFEFGLRFSRTSKQWSLSCGTRLPCDDQNAVEWTPLSDANLEAKLYAVQKFPEFLAEMAKAQDALVQRLEETHKGLDTLARTIGLGQQKEGK